MPKYIERESLLEDIENTLVFSGRLDRMNPKQVGARMVVQRIKEATAADVAPVVHGRWVPNKVYGDYECSVCKQGDIIAPYFKRLKMHYCPNCGARMDGDNA